MKIPEQLITIEWIDAESEDAWEDYTEANREPPTIKTAGYLIKESSTYIVIALSIDPRNEKCSSRIQIPTGMIVKKKKWPKSRK